VKGGVFDHYLGVFVIKEVLQAHIKDFLLFLVHGF